MSDIYRKIAIVGSGAVGLYYGGRLAGSGADVSFLLRSDYDHVLRHGLVIESVAGDLRLDKVSCERESSAIGPVDLVVIAWKATSNIHYEDVVGPLLGERTHILTLQNGLGNVERLAGLFGGWRVFGGLCFVCINRLGPGYVRHSASGMVRVGKYRTAREGAATALVDLLCGAGIECYHVSDLEKAQWMKLVWNIPFNGLSISEGGVDTGSLLEMPGMEDRIMGLMKEVQQVALSLGHVIEDGFLEQQIDVTRKMGGYRPSSMIDYVEGREVEVDAIWREPVNRARELGVETPELERLLAGIERRISVRDGRSQN